MKQKKSKKPVQPFEQKLTIENANNSYSDSEIKTDGFDVALYTLWFSLNYGRILSSAALYKTIEEMGRKPCLIQKPTYMWTDHYANKENIAGSFAYKNCKILEVYSNENDMRQLREGIFNHITGAGDVWNYDSVGKYGNFFFLDETARDHKKLSYGSSFNKSLPDSGLKNEYFRLLNRFDGISVADVSDEEIMREQFAVEATIVLDPVFLCNKDFYIGCAEQSAARANDNERSYIFVQLDHGDSRKKAFTLRGNEILLPKCGSPLRCMIDIDRYDESKNESGFEPARFIGADDWLHYIINSEFVITDNIYAVFFALIFQKPFVIMANDNAPNLGYIKEFLTSLGLSERIVLLQGDLKTKEYLFRKPVRYEKVNHILNEMREMSLEWLTNAMNNEGGNK